MSSVLYFFFVELLLVKPAHFVLVRLRFLQPLYRVFTGGWVFEKETWIKEHLLDSMSSITRFHIPGNPDESPTHLLTKRFLWKMGQTIKITISPGGARSRIIGIGCKNAWGRFLFRPLNLSLPGTYFFILRVGHEPFDLAVYTQNESYVITSPIEPPKPYGEADKQAINYSGKNMPRFFRRL